MSELFDEEEKDLMAEDDFAELNETIMTSQKLDDSSFRRRIESLLEEKRLQKELDDYFE